MNYRPYIQFNLVLAVCISLSLLGCSSTKKAEEVDVITEIDTSESTDTNQDIPEEIAAYDGPSTEEQAVRIMYALSDGSTTEINKALELILDRHDTRFVSVFIELIRAQQIGIVQKISYQTFIAALESLSGQSFGDNWHSWIEWYGMSDLEPPPQFTGWKGKLLGRIDPGFEEFLQDDLPVSIRVEEIQWGGVRVDGIPALDNPSMIPAEDADYLEPREPVFGISINGDSRAYPLRILDWHEMANDVVGGVPISLAYCTLCGAGIAYDGRASDGNIYTFGSSGFLFRSNKLMYDRQTRTLWNQLTGRPVLGRQASSDLKLKILPIVVTSWKEWRNEHPDTLVLSLKTGHNRPYFPGVAYGHYFSSEDTMFPVWQRSNLLPAKSRVFVLQVEGIPKAYPVDILLSERVVNDTIGNGSILLIALGSKLSVKGMSRGEGAVRYDAGAEVRAYDRGRRKFTGGSNPGVVIDSSGAEWKITDEALVGPGGQKAARIGGHLAYWFGWYSFFPNTLVYGTEGK
jgi:hypothetical protein